MTHEQIAHIMVLVNNALVHSAESGLISVDALDAIEAALAPQQAEEILQSLGWTCIGGVWTEDRAATATLAPQQAEGWVSLDRKLVEQAVEVLMEMGLEDTGLGLHNAMLAARPSAPTAVEPRDELLIACEKLIRACWIGDIDGTDIDEAKAVVEKARASKGTK